VEPVPVEVSSNHVIESSLDVTDDSKLQQQQQQQPVSVDLTSSGLTTAVAVTPSASRRDVISSRAEYMTSSPTSPPVANGLIR